MSSVAKVCNYAVDANDLSISFFIPRVRHLAVSDSMIVMSSMQGTFN